MSDNAFLVMMMHRLNQPNSQCTTRDPSQADLFLVPIMPKVSKIEVIFVVNEFTNVGTTLSSRRSVPLV